jgi:hypothetical protein
MPISRSRLRVRRIAPARGPPPTRSDPGSLSSTTHLGTGSLATTPRRRRLALPAPTRSRTTPRLRTTGARTALPPPAPGRGAGTATGRSPALVAKTAASPPLRSSSRTTASDPPTAKGGLEPGCPCRRASNQGATQALVGTAPRQQEGQRAVRDAVRRALVRETAAIDIVAPAAQPAEDVGQSPDICGPDFPPGQAYTQGTAVLSRRLSGWTARWTVRWTVLSASERFLAVRSGRQPDDRIRPIPNNHGKFPQIVRCRRRDSNPRHADYDSARFSSVCGRFGRFWTAYWTVLSGDVHKQ